MEDWGDDGVADVLLQFLALLFVLFVEPDQSGDEDDEQHDDDPDAFAELHDDEDQDDAEREHPAKPLMTSLYLQPFSRMRRWCLAMPAPAMVKPVKTPTA